MDQLVGTKKAPDMCCHHAAGIPEEGPVAADDPPPLLELVVAHVLALTWMPESVVALDVAERLPLHDAPGGRGPVGEGCKFTTAALASSVASAHCGAPH